jgi:NADPH:quinone reductase-like Zn-dependent oxidoreductase
MRAYFTHRYGPPGVQQLVQDVPRPVPKKGELLIKVYATTVNRTDTGFRSAVYVVSRLVTGLTKPRRPIMGTDFAGVVEAVGEGVQNFVVGDRVFGFDDHYFGAHAEYMVLPENRMVTTMPSGINFATAAAVPEGAHYALTNLRAAKIKPGDCVLVYGATGAIGSAAVQLAKHFGATVTAVCSGTHVSVVETLGADEVINRDTQDFTATAKRFDLIFDAVGKSSFGVCKPLLKPGGAYCSTEPGVRGENIYLALWFALTRRRSVLFPIPPTTKELVEYLKNLVEQKQFMPLIDRIYNFTDLVEATEYVESGQKIGNVVIRVQDEDGVDKK